MYVYFQKGTAKSPVREISGNFKRESTKKFRHCGKPIFFSFLFLQEWGDSGSLRGLESNTKQRSFTKELLPAQSQLSSAIKATFQILSSASDSLIPEQLQHERVLKDGVEAWGSGSHLYVEVIYK